MLQIVGWCLNKLNPNESLLKYLMEHTLMLLYKFSIRNQENSHKPLISMVEVNFLNESLNILDICTSFEPSLIQCLYQFKHTEALIHNLFIKQINEKLQDNTFMHF